MNQSPVTIKKPPKKAVIQRQTDNPTTQHFHLNVENSCCYRSVPKSLAQIMPVFLFTFQMTYCFPFNFHWLGS